MRIQPVNVATVVAALMAMLANHPDIGLKGITIEACAEPPEDPGSEGYIGIYKGPNKFVPRVLGQGTGYRDQFISLAIHIRMSGYDDPQECNDALEEIVTNVLSALLSDCTIGGTVDNIAPNMEVQYPTILIDKKDKEYVQIANIFFDLETQVAIVEE